MKAIRVFFSIALATLLACPAPSWAVEGDVTIGVEVAAGDYDNAKFREYRFNTDDPVNAYMDVEMSGEPGGARFYGLDLKTRTAEDVDLALETGSYGKYRFGMDFRRFGHNFANGVKTMYSGVGSDTLTLPDSTQTRLQLTTTSGLPAALRSYVNDAGQTDVGLRRDQVGMDFAWELSKPLAWNLEMDYEKRTGVRPFGAAFGSPGGNAVEIFEPINYDTTRVENGLRYSGKSFSAGIEHSLSVFNNENSYVRYDNPLRATPSATLGPVAGQTALAPDNMANHLSASYSQKLPMHSRVTASAGAGWMRQNDDLLPVTINSALAAGTSPRKSAEAKVDTRAYGLSLSSRPLKKLHVKADYKYDSHKNNTPIYSITSWSVSDASISASPKDSNYVSVVKRVAEIEAAYDIASKTVLSLGAENEHANYVNGSADKENDNVYKVSLDSRKIKATDLRLTLEHSNKNSDYSNYVSANAELPWMRKYYAASRDRNRAIVMASVMPSDKLTAGVEYSYGVDKYPDSAFGVTDSVFQSVSVDAGYQVTERISVAPFYTFEVYKAHQRSRQWTPGAIGDPYGQYTAIETQSNWTLESLDVIHTPGLNLDVILVPEKLNWSSQGSVAVANNKLNFDSGVGTAANDTSAFVPSDANKVDDNYLMSLKTQFEYALKKDVSVSLGYLYERWIVKDDYIYNGYVPVEVTGAGAYANSLTNDTMYKPYNVHAVYVQGSYRF